MENVLDVFKSDQFSMRSMVAAINKLPKKPGKISSLGIFQSEGVNTRAVGLEEINGAITLVQTSLPGAPGRTIAEGERVERSLNTVHIKATAGLLAEKIAGVKAYGSQTQLETFGALVTRKLQDLNNSLDATLEYHMAGALQGVVKDADGTTILDLCSALGLGSAPDAPDFVLGTDSTAVDKLVIDVKRRVEDACGNDTVERIMCYASPEWFDKFVAHPAVQWAFQAQNENSFGRADVRSGFVYKDVMFAEYRDRVGGKPLIAAGDARFFPIGPSLYNIYYSPADYIETVNTMGLPRYAKQKVMDFDRGIEIEAQTNPLVICRRPRALIRAYSSN